MTSRSAPGESGTTVDQVADEHDLPAQGVRGVNRTAFFITDDRVAQPVQERLEL